MRAESKAAYCHQRTQIRLRPYYTKAFLVTGLVNDVRRITGSPHYAGVADLLNAIEPDASKPATEESVRQMVKRIESLYDGRLWREALREGGDEE